MLHMLDDDASPRARLLRYGLMALALMLLMVFYKVCSSQVHAAEVREAAVQVQRIAISDCLQYVPNATIGGCAGGVAALNPDGSIPRDAQAGGLVPVNFVYR